MQSNVYGLKVVGNDNEIKDYIDCYFVCAVGSSK